MKHMYAIEKIMQKKIDHQTGQTLYLVKWIGYPHSQSTWEPKKHFSSCPKIIDNFQRLNEPKKRGSKPKLQKTKPISKQKLNKPLQEIKLKPRRKSKKDNQQIQNKMKAKQILKKKIVKSVKKGRGNKRKNIENERSSVATVKKQKIKKEKDSERKPEKKIVRSKGRPQGSRNRICFSKTKKSKINKGESAKRQRGRPFKNKKNQMIAKDKLNAQQQVKRKGKPIKKQNIAKVTNKVKQQSTNHRRRRQRVMKKEKIKRVIKQIKQKRQIKGRGRKNKVEQEEEQEPAVAHNQIIREKQVVQEDENQNIQILGLKMNEGKYDFLIRKGQSKFWESHQNIFQKNSKQLCRFYEKNLILENC